MKFIPDYANISEPIRRLTRKGQKWAWTSETEKSFNEMKRALVREPCLAYYKIDAPTVVICDASPVGLGATAHRASGETPAKLMFGRDIRTKLPHLVEEDDKAKDIQKHHKQYTDKMKDYADKTNRAKEHNFEV